MSASKSIAATQHIPDGGVDTVDSRDDEFLAIKDLAVTFSDRFNRNAPSNVVIDNLSLDIRRGELVTIIGQSGCGKSTLLGCLAGLERPTSGEIRLDGRVVKGPGPERVVVFQQASLFPWRSVANNIAYGRQIQRRRKHETAERVAQAIAMVGLEGYEQHYPHQISGGMQQRVNLARALVMDAPVILMDEPFGALDAMTKRSMQDELLRVQEIVGATVVFVTHDLEEAVYLGDRVVAMSKNPGRISADVTVPFSRPRDRSLLESAEFRNLVGSLHRELGF